MKLFRYLVAITFLCLLFTKNGSSQTTGTEPARTVVHLLDYIAQDYTFAVKEGEVINE